jgi:4'-phosphopantetheinyl transferase
MLILPPGDVDVWLTDTERVPDAAISYYSTLLSPDETARCERFMFDADRRLYLIAHARLRLVLSEYACVQPKRWEFHAEPHGRPILYGAGRHGLYFSLSHTAGAVAVAVSTSAWIGVDIEASPRALDHVQLAPRVCGASECRWLGSLSPERARRAFLQLWTLKEAYAKATGLGLSLDVAQVTFALKGGLVVPTFNAIADDASDRWHFQSLSVMRAQQLGLAFKLPADLPPRVRMRW